MAEPNAVLADYSWDDFDVADPAPQQFSGSWDDVSTGSPAPSWIGPEPLMPLMLSEQGNRYTELRSANAAGSMGFMDSIQDWDKQDRLFTGDFYAARNIYSVIRAKQALDRGERPTDDDLIALNVYAQEEHRLQNATTGGKVGETLKGAAKFWGEIGAITAAVVFPFDAVVGDYATISARLGEKAAIEAAKAAEKRALKGFAKKRFFGQILRNGLVDANGQMVIQGLKGGAKASAANAVKGLSTSILGKNVVPEAALDVFSRVAVGSVDIAAKATVLTALNPGMAKKGIAEQRLTNYLTTGDPDSRNAVVLGILDAWIENASEMSGEYMGKSLAGILSKVPGGEAVSKMVLGHGAFRMFTQKHGATTVDKFADFMQGAGAHSVIEEMMEERLGGFMRGLTGVHGEAGLVNAVRQSMPTLEQMGVEAIAFAIPGVVGNTAGWVGRKFQGPVATVNLIDNTRELDRGISFFDQAHTVTEEDAAREIIVDATALQATQAIATPDEVEALDQWNAQSTGQTLQDYERKRKLEGLYAEALMDGKGHEAAKQAVREEINTWPSAASRAGVPAPAALLGTGMPEGYLGSEGTALEAKRRLRIGQINQDQYNGVMNMLRLYTQTGEDVVVQFAEEDLELDPSNPQDYAEILAAKNADELDTEDPNTGKTWRQEVDEDAEAARTGENPTGRRYYRAAYHVLENLPDGRQRSQIILGPSFDHTDAVHEVLHGLAGRGIVRGWAQRPGQDRAEAEEEWAREFSERIESGEWWTIPELDPSIQARQRKQPFVREGRASVRREAHDPDAMSDRVKIAMSAALAEQGYTFQGDDDLGTILKQQPSLWNLDHIQQAYRNAVRVADADLRDQIDLSSAIRDLGASVDQMNEEGTEWTWTIPTSTGQTESEEVFPTEDEAFVDLENYLRQEFGPGRYPADSIGQASVKRDALAPEGRQIIGVIDSNGAVKTVDVEDAATADHREHFSQGDVMRGQRFRYDNGEIIWTGTPTADERIAAQDHFENQGLTFRDTDQKFGIKPFRGGQASIRRGETETAAAAQSPVPEAEDFDATAATPGITPSSDSVVDPKVSAQPDHQDTVQYSIRRDVIDYHRQQIGPIPAAAQKAITGMERSVPIDNQFSVWVKAQPPGFRRVNAENMNKFLDAHPAQAAELRSISDDLGITGDIFNDKGGIKTTAIEQLLKLGSSRMKFIAVGHDAALAARYRDPASLTRMEKNGELKDFARQAWGITRSAKGKTLKKTVVDAQDRAIRRELMELLAENNITVPQEIRSKKSLDPLYQYGAEQLEIEEPSFPGFRRTFGDMIVDRMTATDFESMRSTFSSSIEHAYVNGGRGDFMPVEYVDTAVGPIPLRDTTRTTKQDGTPLTKAERVAAGIQAATDVPTDLAISPYVGSPLKKAEKTMAALNLNVACPMFVVGNSGCWLNACYLTQGGEGNGNAYYERRAYTAEILQMPDDTIDLLNTAGGLRVNGLGDLTIAQAAQLRDIVRHSGMRGLNLKFISKQAATPRMLQAMHDEGIDISHASVQMSMDYLWSPVETDLRTPGSGILDTAFPNTPVNAAVRLAEQQPDYVIDAYREQYDRDARQSDGGLERKYGLTHDSAMALLRENPDVNMLPRWVLTTPQEIADTMLQHPGEIYTLMHGKVSDLVQSDLPGGGFVNFGSKRHTVDVNPANGRREMAGYQHGRSEPYRGGAYVAVNDYIYENYNARDQKKIYDTLQKGMCCQENESADACADCAAHCAASEFVRDVDTQMPTPDDATPLGSEGVGQASVRQRTVTPEQDAEYAAAVERGDMVTAQRLVDAAAYATGYTTEGFHGTPGDEAILVFDTEQIGSNLSAASGTKGVGFYFSSSRLNALWYANPSNAETEVDQGFTEDDVQVYGDPGAYYYVIANFEVESIEHRGYNDGPFPTEAEAQEAGEAQIAELADAPPVPGTSEDAQVIHAYLRMDNPKVVRSMKALREAEVNPEGHDGLIAKQVSDGFAEGDVYVVFDPNQIKSADAVTRDNDGNVIPLSERFNEESPDIRNSVRRDAGFHERLTPEEIPPETQMVYKLMKLNKRQPGRLMPLFAGGMGFTMGDWQRAERNPPAGLADRSGIHSVNLPVFAQGKAQLKAGPRRMWVEVEVPVFNPATQAEADALPKLANGQDPGIRERVIGPNEAYDYKTNNNATDAETWPITGSARPNRILSDSEVEAILRAAGKENQIANSRTGIDDAEAARLNAAAQAEPLVGQASVRRKESIQGRINKAITGRRALRKAKSPEARERWMYTKGRFHEALAQKAIQDEMSAEWERKRNSKSVDVDKLRDVARNWIEAYVPFRLRGYYLKSLSKLDSMEGLDRIVKQARKQFDKVQKQEAIKQFEKAKPSKTQLKHMRPEFKELVETLSDTYDTKRMSNKIRHKLERRLEYLENHPEDHTLPPKELEEIGRLIKMPLSEHSAADILSLADRLKSLRRQNAQKNLYISRGRKRAQEDHTKRFRYTLNKAVKANDGMDDTGVFDTARKPRQRTAVGTFAEVESTSLVSKAHRMDGGPTGPAHEVLDVGFEEGMREMRALEFEAWDAITTASKEAGVDKTWSRLLSSHGKAAKPMTILLSPGPNGKKRTITLTKGERLDLIMHSRAHFNTAQLLRSKIVTRDNPTRGIQLLGEDIDAIIESATPEELQLADDFRNIIDNIVAPAVNATSLNLWGYEVATEPNYWHLGRSIEKGREAPLPFTEASLQGQGIYKERTGGSRDIMLEDGIAKIFRHVRQSTMFATMAEPIQDARVFLKSRENKDAIVHSLGMGFYEGLKRHVDNIEDVGKAVAPLESQRRIEGLFHNIVREILGANPGVIAKQPASYVLAQLELGNKAWLAGMRKMSKAEVEQMYQYSPVMRYRAMGMVTREMGQVAEAGLARQMITGDMSILDIPLQGIRQADLLAVRRIWKASEFWVRQNKPDLYNADAKEQSPEFWEATARKAEDVVRLTQPSYEIKDRSLIASQPGVFWRLGTAFSTQRNKNYNVMYRAMAEYSASDKGAEATNKLATAMTMVLVINAMMVAAIDGLRDLFFRRKEKWYKYDRNGEKKFDWTEATLQTVRNDLGNVYFLGSLFDTVVTAARSRFGRRRGNVLLSTEDELSSFVRGVTEAVDAHASQRPKDAEKFWEAVGKSGKAAISLGGKVSGIPIRNVLNWSQAAWKQVSPIVANDQAPRREENKRERQARREAMRQHSRRRRR